MMAEIATVAAATVSTAKCQLCKIRWKTGRKKNQMHITNEMAIQFVRKIFINDCNFQLFLSVYKRRSSGNLMRIMTI